jgi:hypothetical protein
MDIVVDTLANEKAGRAAIVSGHRQRPSSAAIVAAGRTV